MGTKMEAKEVPYLSNHCNWGYSDKDTTLYVYRCDLREDHGPRHLDVPRRFLTAL